MGFIITNYSPGRNGPWPKLKREWREGHQRYARGARVEGAAEGQFGLSIGTKKQITKLRTYHGIRQFKLQTHSLILSLRF